MNMNLEVTEGNLLSDFVEFENWSDELSSNVEVRGVFVQELDNEKNGRRPLWFSSFFVHFYKIATNVPFAPNNTPFTPMTRARQFLMLN